MTDDLPRWALRRYGLLIAFFLLGIVVCAPAYAVSLTLGTNPLPLSPGGPYAVSRNAVIGTQLATATSVVNGSGITGACTVTAVIVATGTIGSGGTFTTSVPGIGVNLYYYNGTTKTQIASTIGIDLSIPLSGPGQLTKIEADLVVTGPVGAGTIGALPTVGIVILTAVGGGCGILNLGLQTLTITDTPGTVTASSCVVTNSAITVNLPTVSIQRLATSGQTAGVTRFTIPLNCSGAGSNVYVTLTDAANTANTTSLLTLSGTSTATKVKLQILNGAGAPVTYGPDSATAGNPGQFKVGPSSTTTQIPLMVEYYSTGAATAGTVKAAATFTMSYQ